MKNKTVVVIIFLISIFLFQNLLAQNRNKEGFNHENYPMYKRLNLTEEQQDQISTMKINHQMEMVDLKANLEKNEIELTSLKNKGNYTREQYLAAIRSINSARDEIAISRAEFQMDVYQILDDKQKEEWNKMSFNFGERREKRVIKKMRELEIN
jgi:Spy/CpxP family protein refolding chaperone